MEQNFNKLYALFTLLATRAWITDQCEMAILLDSIAISSNPTDADMAYYRTLQREWSGADMTLGSLQFIIEREGLI